MLGTIQCKGPLLHSFTDSQFNYFIDVGDKGPLFLVSMEIDQVYLDPVQAFVSQRIPSSKLEHSTTNVTRCTYDTHVHIQCMFIDFS